MNINDKIIFHGSKLPEGTESKVLHSPSILNPFYAAHEYKMALAYAYTKGAGNGSIFILYLIDSPNKIGFDYSNESDLNKLYQKLPKTVNCILSWKDASKRWGDYGSTVWELLLHDAQLIPSMYNHTQDFKDDPHYNVILEMNNELGVFENEKVMKTLLTANYSDSFMHKKRRKIQSLLFNEIYSLGYKIVIENSTLVNRAFGVEYAILNKSVIDSGWSVSISPDEKKIEKVLEKINLK